MNFFDFHYLNKRTTLCAYAWIVSLIDSSYHRKKKKKVEGNLGKNDLDYVFNLWEDCIANGFEFAFEGH